MKTELNKKIWLDEETHRLIKTNASKYDMRMPQYVKYLVDNTKDTIQENKHQTYLDLSYDDKLKKIWEYYNLNADTFEIINYIIFKATNNYVIDQDIFLNSLLIDGYVAYEKIYNKGKTKVINYVPLSPLSLTPKMDGKKKVWVQYKGSDNERILFD